MISLLVTPYNDSWIWSRDMTRKMSYKSAYKYLSRNLTPIHEITLEDYVATKFS